MEKAPPGRTELFFAQQPYIAGLRLFRRCVHDDSAQIKSYPEEESDDNPETGKACCGTNVQRSFRNRGLGSLGVVAIKDTHT